MAWKSKEQQREYNRKYNEQNREKRREWNAKYRSSDKGKTTTKNRYDAIRIDPEMWAESLKNDRSSAKKRRQERRMHLIQTFGGKCSKCGFDDWRALQIDHIDGGGNHERFTTNSMNKYYDKMIQNPQHYQLLCANCNQIKRYENGEGYIVR